jgi:hypothetical protein
MRSLLAKHLHRSKKIRATRQLCLCALFLRSVTFEVHGLQCNFARARGTLPPQSSSMRWRSGVIGTSSL